MKRISQIKKNCRDGELQDGDLVDTPYGVGKFRGYDKSCAYVDFELFSTKVPRSQVRPVEESKN